MMTSSHKPELISDLTKLHETCLKSVIFVHSTHVALFSHTFDSTRRFALNTSGVSLDYTPLLAPWAPPAFEAYGARKGAPDASLYPRNDSAQLGDLLKNSGL